ncbi:MAG: hypothetical protein LBU99_00825, partial [Spirochaetaceae bacterium]|nr:hypothetical protein [Spirochaetaceae bacterium]
MKKMFKTVGLIALLAVITMMVVGCPQTPGNTNPGGDDPGNTDTKEKTLLKVLNYRDMTQANATDEDVQIWNPFRTKNPDVTVELENLFLEPFHQRTAADAAAGKLSDVVYAWPSGRSTILHHGRLLKDLTPF